MYNRELDLYQGGEAGESDGWGGNTMGTDGGEAFYEMNLQSTAASLCRNPYTTNIYPIYQVPNPHDHYPQGSTFHSCSRRPFTSYTTIRPTWTISSSIYILYLCLPLIFLLLHSKLTKDFLPPNQPPLPLPKNQQSLNPLPRPRSPQSILLPRSPQARIPNNTLGVTQTTPTLTIPSPNLNDPTKPGDTLTHDFQNPSDLVS